MHYTSTEDTVQNVARVVAVLGIIGFWILLLYILWWELIGEDQFDSPFADSISAGEVTRSIFVYIILIIYLLLGIAWLTKK